MASLMRPHETQARLPSLSVVLGPKYSPAVLHLLALKTRFENFVMMPYNFHCWNGAMLP